MIYLFTKGDNEPVDWDADTKEDLRQLILFFRRVHL